MTEFLKYKKILLLSILMLPMPVFAQAQNLKELVLVIRDVIDMLVPLVFAVAVLFFLYGIFKYFFVDADKPESREKGRRFILWGILALFVMVSFWGFVNILSNTIFGVESENVTEQVGCFEDPHLCDEL